MPRVRKILRPKAPYDFARALDYLRIWPAVVVERIGDGMYRRAITIDGRDVLLVLHSIGTTAAPRLVLDVRGPRVTPAVAERAAQIVRRSFALDDGTDGFIRAVRGDPVMARVARRFRATRPISIIDPFEAVLWAIMGQQVNLAFARRMKLGLIELCGRQLRIGGETFPMFPAAEQVAELDAGALRQRQFSRQKIEYMQRVACQVAEGSLNFEALRAMAPQQAFENLIAIKGIGRWTAEYLLVRALGMRDFIPAADIGLRNAIGHAYGMNRNATEEETRRVAEQWKGWRGWAAFYWWLHRLTDGPRRSPGQA